MILAAPQHPVSVADALQRMEQEATQGTLDTGRYRCPYVVWGSGPPVVFVHGMGDSLNCFVLPMALLSRDFQCIAYTQPGGRGDLSRLRKYRHEDLVADLFCLMDHLGVVQAPLVGHSFGSTVVLRAMHTKPERVPRGVLSCGFAQRSLAAAEWWLAWMARFWPGHMRHLPLRKSALQRFHYGPFAGCEPETWDFFLKVSGTPLIRSVAHWALLLHQTDVRDLLPTIRQPVLLICGDCDPLVPRSYQEYLFRHLPNAVMFQITNCGHFPMYTHPAIFAATIRRFLQAPACQLVGARDQETRAKDQKSEAREPCPTAGSQKGVR